MPRHRRLRRSADRCRTMVACVLFAAQARAETPGATTETAVAVRALPRAASATSVSLTAEKAASGAGTQGDAVKVLDALPGLGRGAPGDFVAWGSSPLESRFYVDGVEVPRLYHGSGVRSVVPTSRLSTLEVTPGGFGAEDGGALGGLVRLTTREPDPEGPRLFASADLLDAAALASAPLGDRAAVLGAARYGYADRWLDGVIDPAAKNLYVIPSYWDVQAETSLALRAGESLRVAGLASSDHSSVSVAATDPARAQTESGTVAFGRLYAVYASRASDGAESRVVPYVGWDTDLRGLTFGARSATLDVRSTVYGLRARHRALIAPSLVLSLGADAAGSASSVLRDGSAAVPRREGDPYPFGTPPGAETARDEYDVHRLSLSPYASLRAEMGPLVLEPGLRLEGFLVVASRNHPPVGTLPDVAQSTLIGYPDPRIAATVRLSSRVELVAAAGRYHQAPSPADLGAVFGNPALLPMSAVHLTFGERARLLRNTSVEVLAFSKWLSDLPARSSDATPPVSRAIVQGGEGRAYGVQMMVRQGEIAGFSGFLSATLSRSERTDPGKPERLSDYDSPLLLALALQKAFGAFRVALRGRYATGLPRTPVVSAYYDLGADRFVPLLGGTNATRLGNFAQLDVRFDRRFDLGDAAVLTLYVDLLNVTFRRNQEEYVYSSDFRERGAITGLPTLAVVGASVQL